VGKDILKLVAVLVAGVAYTLFVLHFAPHEIICPPSPDGRACRASDITLTILTCLIVLVGIIVAAGVTSELAQGISRSREVGAVASCIALAVASILVLYFEYYLSG